MNLRAVTIVEIYSAKWQGDILSTVMSEKGFGTKYAISYNRK